MAFQYLKITAMRRADKQVYNILKASTKPLTLEQLANETEYSARHIQRVISRLRGENLVRGVQDVRDSRKTVYEPIS